MGYPAPEPRGALIRRTRCFDTSHISVAPPLGPGVRPPASPPPRRSTGEQSACDSRHSAGSCEQCPTPWLPFQGSCYLFSKAQATWNAAQESCAGAGAHLVIVGDLDEQVRSPAVGAWPGRWAGREAGSQAQWLLTHPPPGLPESVHAWPRLLAGAEGRAPRARGPGLPVGGRSHPQLQVREGTWGGGQVRAEGKRFGPISRPRLGCVDPRNWLRAQLWGLATYTQVHAQRGPSG